jgi:hypothetical protein
VHLSDPDVQPVTQGFHLVNAKDPWLHPGNMDSSVDLIDYAFNEMSLQQLRK